MITMMMMSKIRITNQRRRRRRRRRRSWQNIHPGGGQPPKGTGRP